MQPSRTGHACAHLAEAEEVHDAVAEVAEGGVQISHEVQRQAVVREDDDKKDAVHEEVQHVGDELQVEYVDALPRQYTSSIQRGAAC